MLPVLTVAEMGAVDARARETTPLEVLVGRAGRAAARAATELLGGTYGRRVTVVAGRGNNGADGRVAAELLTRRGARVAVVDAGADDRLGAPDLVIDAAYGTGFHGEYREIVPNERIVSTEFYEGVPKGVSEEDATTLNTTTFTEAEGRTKLSILVQAKNRMTRDAIIESGMEDGLQDALELLEQAALSLR